MPRINPTVTEKARQIYDSIPLKDRGHFISDAIIEKWAKEHGEVFTAEQIQWIRKEIAKELKK